VGISRDYPLKTRTSKQPIGEILGIEIIPSHPLKYPRSKQGLTVGTPDFACLHLIVTHRKFGVPQLHAKGWRNSIRCATNNPRMYKSFLLVVHAYERVYYP
jgi:hypothetical protein